MLLYKGKFRRDKYDGNLDNTRSRRSVGSYRRDRFRREIYFFKKAPRTVDDVIGMHCTVVERIDNYAGCGQVAVAGQSWSARGAEDDDEFEVGESLRIVAVEGVKLICMKN